MESLKRVIGIVHILAAFAVALQQMSAPTWEDSGMVWDFLNPVMFVFIALALIFNFMRKRENDSAGGSSVTREYVESNVLFYLTAALAILFVYNWVGELTRGAEESRGTLTGIVWTYVNITFILISASTGAHLLRSLSK